MAQPAPTSAVRQGERVEVEELAHGWIVMAKVPRPGQPEWNSDPAHWPTRDLAMAHAQAIGTIARMPVIEVTR